MAIRSRSIGQGSSPVPGGIRRRLLFPARIYVAGCAGGGHIVLVPV